jgi:catechol 2,3-dioxygenase-like lactoylglutathione lyase family enzyme
MLRGYHHVTLRVTDLDRSRSFYSALPGFVLDQDFSDLEKLRYRIGDSRARLVLCAPLPGTPPGARHSRSSRPRSVLSAHRPMG